MPRAARASAASDYNRNRARRAHLLKPSAVSRQPSAETTAERASDVFQSFSLPSFPTQKEQAGTCPFRLPYGIREKLMNMSDTVCRSMRRRRLLYRFRKFQLFENLGDLCLHLFISCFKLFIFVGKYFDFELCIFVV